MTPLWIVLSTFCHLPCPTYIYQEKLCIQQAKISFTEPELKEGETAYQVMPDSHGEKVADKESRYYPHIHRWRDYQELVYWTEKCYCGKKRRKVNVEKWVEE